MTETWLICPSCKTGHSTWGKLFCPYCEADEREIYATNKHLSPNPLTELAVVVMTPEQKIARGIDRTGDGETLNGKILRAMCAVDGLPTIIAHLLTEVERQEASEHGFVLMTDDKEKLAIGNAAWHVREALRLIKEIKNG
jgi:hypothetical protein